MAKRLSKKQASAKTPGQPMLVVTSDNHLQERAWHNRPDLSGDAIFAFGYIVDYCCAHHLPLVLAGDVIDKQENRSRVPGFLLEQLTRMHNEDQPVYFIQGQHELQESPWLRELGQGAETIWVNAAPVELRRDPHRVCLYGIDWTPADQLQAKLDAIPPDADVLVMHQVCHEWLGGIAEAELRWSQIPGHIKLLIVGDYHEFSGTIVRENAAGNEMTILSPGSTAMQSITEPPGKFFYVVYDDLGVAPVKIPTRIVLRPPDVSHEQQLDKIVQDVRGQIEKAIEQAERLGLPPELHKPILYMRFAWDIPKAHDRIMRAVDSTAHVFVKELRPKNKDGQAEEEIEAREAIIEGGLLGALALVAPDEESERYKLAHRLLTAPNKREALVQIREEYLGTAAAG